MMQVFAIIDRILVLSSYIAHTLNAPQNIQQDGSGHASDGDSTKDAHTKDAHERLLYCNAPSVINFARKSLIKVKAVAKSVATGATVCRATAATP